MKQDAETDLLLIGGGGHCRSVIEALTGTHWKAAGIIDKNPLLYGMKINEIPVLGSDAELERLKNDFEYALVTVGQTISHEPRAKLFNKLKQAGFKLPVIIANSAIASRSAKIGSGTILLHFALVNANAQIGENCILNSRSLVEHDAIIGDNCHVSTGAIVNGGARIGDNVFIGSGAIIREGASVGANSLVGMGSIVRKDVPGGVTFWNEGGKPVIQKNPYARNME